jgi:PIN domain nuclease of toxin-antitoxin system
MSGEPRLLLDTCAVLFIANDTPIAPETERSVSEAAFDGRLYVSPMSAWEIGVGVAKRRLRLPLARLDFFGRFLDRMGARLSEVSPAILVASSFLPGDMHKDPIDRILMASARALDMVLVTSDGPILEYGQQGHLRTLAC